MATQTRKRARAADSVADSGYEKLAITMPSRTVRRARAQVEGGGGRSLSAFISQAVEEKLESDEFQDVLDEIFRDQPMTAEEQEWADSLILGR